MQKKCDSTIQQNMLQIQCKKMQMKSANPLQTSNCSQKNANRTCKFIANKIKKKTFTFNIPVSTKQILITSSTVHPGLKQLPPNKTTSSA